MSSVESWMVGFEAVVLVVASKAVELDIVVGRRRKAE